MGWGQTDSVEEPATSQACWLELGGSAVPSSPSIVANGTWAGYLLTDVIARRPKAILGKSVASKYGNQLPLLAKFTDANNDLCIQVHPDDAMARREHNKLGKSEM